MPERPHLVTRAAFLTVCGAIGVALSACNGTTTRISPRTADLRSANNNAASVVAHADTTKPVRGTPFGDTASFGARIVGLKPNLVTSKMDATSFRTTFALREPAYLIWLEVVPGQSIALLYPTSGTQLKRADAGEQSANFRYTALTGGQSRSSISTRAQQCIDAAIERSRPAEQPRRSHRDKNGTIVFDEPPRTALPVNVAAIRGNCISTYPLSAENGSGSVQQSERYLIMLASHVAYKADQLNRRLDELEVSANSVKATMEAVAQGLYVDRQAVWAGYYVAW